ncbi:hypothetical protein A9Q84_11850 [Halobacteriovorax marinus]|uniref:Uncharacterized protein n=1 Tax=Halobacteriovorax marinus TaxID=97084 RepID=A0A1Y5FDH9_9BACT|nr:hypothetical protein A9Q84_11850 [Halobacteriovorax marinus]
MKFIIVVIWSFFVLDLASSVCASEPLFSEKELQFIEYLRSPEYLRQQRRHELKLGAKKSMDFLLKNMSKWEMKTLSTKYHKKFWTNFDKKSDGKLRKKIMFELIFNDLYKYEGVEDDR